MIDGDPYLTARLLQLRMAKRASAFVPDSWNFTGRGTGELLRPLAPVGNAPKAAPPKQAPQAAPRPVVSPEPSRAPTPQPIAHTPTPVPAPVTDPEPPMFTGNLDDDYRTMGPAMREWMDLKGRTAQMSPQDADYRRFLYLKRGLKDTVSRLYSERFDTTQGRRQRAADPAQFNRFQEYARRLYSY